MARLFSDVLVDSMPSSDNKLDFLPKILSLPLGDLKTKKAGKISNSFVNTTLANYYIPFRTLYPFINSFVRSIVDISQT